MTKRYLVRTFGCQMNEHDSQRLAGLLESEGMESARDMDDADVIILNTCCIRENADNKLYGTLGHLKSLKDRRPDVEILVGGCLAQKDRQQIADRAPHVDVVFGTHNVGHVTDLLRRSRSEGQVVEIVEAGELDDDEAFPSALPIRREVSHSAWVTIQMGCDNSCAFCIVPAVRGPEVSRPVAELVAEVELLAERGVTEVTLLGQNVNSYGRDLTLSARRAGADVRIQPLFADLLRQVGAVDGIRRVRFTSPHPKDLRSETIAAMAETDAVCEHLHLPMQSGSDSILAAMHRGYTAERYLDRVTAARAGIADLAVSTDIIVGFPGETDADFDATLEVAAAADLDSAFTFVFSPRPGTEAAEMGADAVDHHVAVERMERLRTVVERSSHRRNQARIGRIEEVIVEGPSKRDPDTLTGRTRQNKLVHFASPAPIRTGSYVLVEVTGAGLSSLQGVFREVTPVATHRTRIPLAVG